MKRVLVVASFSLFLMFLAGFETILCGAQFEWNTRYRINVRPDGSASWMIERGTLIRRSEEWNFLRYSSPEHLQEFIYKIDSLVKQTQLETQRDMKVPHNSLKITATITSRTETSSYGIVRYQFDWLNFTQIRDAQIIIGDAFIDGIWDVFLFGDGELVLEYPHEYDVKKVNPQPDVKDANQTLIWFRIGTFGIKEPDIILEKKSSGTMSLLQKYALAILGAITLFGIGSASLWFFKFRKKEKLEAAILVPKVTLGPENEEEKVINLLKAARGSLYQSIIAKELGFSRSKTSKLLTEMENKGKLKRKRKGREKLVTLINEVAKKKK
jgi:uncharacterized membrane protein